VNPSRSVLFDREIFLIQKYGGISNYFSKLVFEFSIEPRLGVNPQLSFSRTSNFHLKSTFNQLSKTEIPPQRYFFQPRNWLTTSLNYGFPRALNSFYAGGFPAESSAELLHATYYRPQYLERRLSKKLAITIHDFIPEKLGWTGLRNPHIGKSKLIKKADLIICVSEQTKNELEDLFDTRRKNVVVIPHGSHPIDNPLLAQKSNQFSILYVGHRAGYKNFEVLLKSLSFARKDRSDYKLIIAGPKLTQAERTALSSTIGIDRCVEVVHPSDEVLRELYKSAWLHVVTSKMEGFGMTILESLSVGTRVLASDIPVFREVGGHEINYFNPENPEELFEKIFIERDSTFDEDAAIQILNRAKLFSWSRTAESHASAYHSLLK
jgi:glycosyltransferase involved in cell wall biosynthesis